MPRRQIDAASLDGEMNRLRRLGYVSYSRLHTDIYASALSEWMRQQGTRVHEAEGDRIMRATG